MNSLIETLNRWGGRIPDFAWPMLWQSSVLIAVLFVFDLAARRRVRASVRYALWLVVLVKLLLPPTLALPTSLAWWVRPAAPQPKAQARTTALVVTYGEFVPMNFPTAGALGFAPPPKPSLSGAGRVAATWAVVGAGLLAWLLVRWRLVARDVRRATLASAKVASGPLSELLDEARRSIKFSRCVRLRFTQGAMSPAVCGLLRPTILLPQSLVERLQPAQLRAVLLHELVHLQRGDVWVNCVQALLQIFYWWHPLLWLANARIRRVREEAVDDAVMLELHDDAESYAPTLLEVAKLAFNRPLASLGLVGIMESRSALRQRIERLVDFRPPRKAGLTITSALCVLAFAALAVPMERAPAISATQVSSQKQTESTNPPPVELLDTNEEVKLRMIVLNKPGGGDAAPMRKRAEDILAKVKGGAAFSEMASVYSEGRQGREGGNWGWVQKYDRNAALVLRKELAAAAFSLQPGEVSGIIETPEAIYLMLVEDKRPAHRDRKIEAIHHTTPPSPNSGTTTNLVFTGMGRQAIVSKLDRLRLDSVFFDDVPLGEVVLWLKDEARKSDPEKRGINFMLNPNPTTPIVPQVDPTSGLPVEASEPPEIKSLPITINPPLTDVRLADVLEAIVRAAGNRVEYSIEDYVVVFSSKSAELEPLHTRTLKFDPEVFLPNLRQRMHLPDKSTDGEAMEALPKYLADAGLDLQPPCSCFLKERGLTLFRAPQEKLEAIERLFTELNNGRPQSEIPNPARPPDQETIIRKLHQIRIDSPAYNETLLIEVVRDLSWETRHRDPEMKGFGFRIKYSAKPGKMVDLSAVKVSVPAFSNARLSDLLEAIIKGADKPIKYYIGAGLLFYSIEDESVLPLGVTLQKALPLMNATQPADAFDPTARMTNKVPVLGDLPLVGKLFRRDIAPATNGSFGNALPKSLYEITPGPRIVTDMYFQVEVREDGSYSASGKQMNLAELRDWLVKTKQSDSNNRVGFQVHSNAPPEASGALTELRKELGMAIGASAAPAALASSSQDGQLNMRSYKVEPSTFYKCLQNVSQSPVTQTNVTAVTRDWFATLGVDWSPPKTIVWNDRSGFLQVRATEQDLDIIEAAMEVLNRVPPQINIKVRFVEIAQEDVRANSFDSYLGNILLANGGGANPVGKASLQFQGVLTDPQFRVLLRAFEQRQGVDLLTTPEVTTVSGRQAQIQVVNMQTVVTGINPQVLASPGIVSTNGETNGVFQTQVMPFGPTLEVIPYVAPDGYKIQMTVIPTVTEFLGYDGSPTYWPTNSIGLPNQPVLPLPCFRTRQMMVTAIIRDGQTLVLANPTVTETFKKPDGSTETKDVSGTQKKQLIVFVTPTLVDETGNRIHRDEEPAPGPK